ncbi:hypothetical protein HYG93_15635 [Acinetobacter sp. SwsAc6]|uniref:hypothetical protein n=1 Tax=Acinetobacter sp. SwsAc6 TaxID=2749439 RepID=UPI0015BA4B0E|nr:hypothetical protein [Acinetobacter sp. SwsAc6]NWK75666.1 hypothetical protein [Acinetobacter sp. SwsAc6]
MENQNSPQPAGFIFVRHIRACGMCTLGAKRFFMNYGLSSAEVQEFYKNGMSVEKFNELFGHDPMAQQVIRKAQDEEKEINGRL